MSFFDAEREFAELNKQTRNIHRRGYRQSRLDRYTDELLALRQAGATASELMRWLHKKRIRVELSTVTRWLKRRADV